MTGIGGPTFTGSALSRLTATRGHRLADVSPSWVAPTVATPAGHPGHEIIFQPPIGRVLVVPAVSVASLLFLALLGAIGGRAGSAAFGTTVG